MKFLKHERDKVGDFQKRVFLHIPIGFIVIISALGHPLLPLPLVWLFIRYEENEDVHTQDQAWKDYFGAIIGAVMASLTIICLVALGE